MKISNLFESEKNFSIEYRNEDGKLHRDNGPAVVLSDGGNEWWLHGHMHRDNGPAVEWANGLKAWYQHGKLHREDGPAVIYSNGNKHWHLVHKNYGNGDTPPQKWIDAGGHYEIN